MASGILRHSVVILAQSMPNTFNSILLMNSTITTYFTDKETKVQRG